MLHQAITICVFGLGVALSAHAAESYDNCSGFVDSLPATISAQGTWCLRHDVSTAITDGYASTIAANNVVLDCNGFKVGGLAAGPATGAVGIGAQSRVNVTVRHCSVRGFLYGIALNGSYLRVEDNRLDLNTFVGVSVSGDGAVVRGNEILDTGGAPSSSNPIGNGLGIYSFIDTDIRDNTVNGVAARGGSNGSAFGIYSTSSASGVISGNQVRGLMPAGTGKRYGIYKQDPGAVAISDNKILQPDAGTGDVGIRCSNGDPIARDNMILGYAASATAILNCQSYANASN